MKKDKGLKGKGEDLKDSRTGVLRGLPCFLNSYWSVDAAESNHSP